MTAAEDTASLTYSHSSFAGRIGVAREDITPPVGIYARSWGAAEHDAAEGVHRPLTLTALTLQSDRDTPPLVLISADLGWWRRAEDEWLVRGGLIDALALDPARVMSCLTHTHAGPTLCAADTDKPGGHLIAPYLERLRDAAISATRRALETAIAATLDWAYGRCTLATNRDLPDPDAPRYICGYSPDAPPADDTLLIGRATTETGQPLATLVNYACHPTTLAFQNRLLSPDYIGAMREVVEEATGSAPCLFLLGACGELAPREQYTGDTSIADAHGRCLGYAVLSTLADMLPPRTRLDYTGVTESGAPLARWERREQAPSSTLTAKRIDVELEVKPLPPAAEIEANLAACTDLYMAERLRRQLHRRLAVGDASSITMSAWLWRVGDAYLVGQPNEAYSQFQRELRAAHYPPGPLSPIRHGGKGETEERAQQAKPLPLPPAPAPIRMGAGAGGRGQQSPTVAVMNVVNGWAGYLPPAEFYDRDLYPVWQTPFAAGGLERLIAACRDGLRSL